MKLINLTSKLFEPSNQSIIDLSIREKETCHPVAEGRAAYSARAARTETGTQTTAELLEVPDAGQGLDLTTAANEDQSFA